MSWVLYHPGGFESSAPAQNMAEQGDDSTQTVTTWDANGTVTGSRPYTAAETASMQAAQQAQTAAANKATSLTNLQNLLAQQSALAQQIQADAAMFQGTTVGSTLQQEHLDALVRIVNGFSTVMGAITDHLTVNGIS